MTFYIFKDTTNTKKPLTPLTTQKTYSETLKNKENKTETNTSPLPNNGNNNYVGKLKGTKKHGQGKLILTTRFPVENSIHRIETYNGSWKNDKKHGKGEYEFQDYFWNSKETYNGEWRNDLRQGKGTENIIKSIQGETPCDPNTTSTTTYKGSWNQDLKHGKFTVTKDGNSHTEIYKNGVLQSE